MPWPPKTRHLNVVPQSVGSLLEGPQNKVLKLSETPISAAPEVLKDLGIKSGDLVVAVAPAAQKAEEASREVGFRLSASGFSGLS